MAGGTVGRWEIYFDPHCRHSRPPKPKFVVVAQVEGICQVALLINSRINRMFQRPKLLPCMVPIRRAQYPFLTQDSFVDCTEAFRYNDGELREYRDTLSQHDANQVLSGVLACRVLPKDEKDLILYSTQEGGLPD